MFTNLTYKKKIILMTFGFIVFLFIAWSLSIKSTFELASQCSVCEEQLEFVKDAPLKIAALQKEIDIKEQILGHSNAGIEFQEHLLKQVTEFCQKNQLILREYPQVHNYVQQEYNIETNEIVIEGQFIKLLKLLYALEQEYKLGKVVSAKFMSKRDFKTNQMKLTLTIYVQNIKKENQEISITKTHTRINHYKKEIMPQIAQIFTDLKQPKVVSYVLTLRKKSVKRICVNSCYLWQKKS